jgi:phosphoserine phosphatase
MLEKNNKNLNSKNCLSIYDLDNTLVKGNTLEDFVFFYKKFKIKNKILYYFVFFFLKIRLYFISKILRTSKSSLLIKQLNGEHRSEIIDVGRAFVKSNIVFNEKILDELKKDISNSNLVYIISGTIKEILDPILSLLNIDGYSSELLYLNDVCQGKFCSDLRANKELKVKEILFERRSIDLSKSKFITDNIEDQSVASKFGTIFAIVLNNKNKKFWKNYTENIFDFTPKITLNNFHYFIPGFYYFKERTNLFTLFERLFFILFVLYITNKLDFLPFSLLLWISFITMYEIGYIDNDFFAVRKEKNPSIRLSKDVSSFQVYKFISIRIFYFLILISICIYFFNFSFFITNIFLIIGVLFIFIIHNRLPQEKRILSYSILKLSHFYIPLFAVIDLFDLLVPLILFYLPYHLFNYLKKFVTNIKFFNPFFFLIFQFVSLLFFLFLFKIIDEFIIISIFLFIVQNVIFFNSRNY